MKAGDDVWIYGAPGIADGTKATFIMSSGLLLMVRIGTEKGPSNHTLDSQCVYTKADQIKRAKQEGF